MKICIKLNDCGKALLGVDSLEFDYVDTITIPRKHIHKVIWKTK